MIRLIKIGNLIYQNIEPKHKDEQGNEIWNIPNNPENLKNCLIDTLGWIVSQNIVKTIGDANKKDASTTKAIVLLAKLVNTLNPDTSKLTENEKNAYEKFLALADAGYSDSTLLNEALATVQEQLQWYAQKLSELNAIDTNSADALDKLIAFAESL